MEAVRIEIYTVSVCVHLCTYVVEFGVGENRETLKQKDLSIFSSDLCEPHQLQVSESVSKGREGERERYVHLKVNSWLHRNSVAIVTSWVDIQVDSCCLLHMAL